MSLPTVPPTVSLYYRDGRSDKEYHASILPAGQELYVVTFQYGRRGSSLTSGTKTAQPVPYAQAQTIFHKLVQEKTAKGYTPGDTGVPYQDSNQSGRVTGMLPQLLNPLEEDRLEEFLDNGSYAQEKKNGRLRQIKKEGDRIIGANKLGLSIALPEPLVQALRALPCQDLALVGEGIGTTLHCFDLTRYDGDVTAAPYATRYDTLVPLIQGASLRALQLVPAATTPAAKRALYARLRAENAEGLVFKDPFAPYTPGRPNSGGPQFKFKFTATSTFVVKKHNLKRSVEIQLLTPQALFVSCGNVTIPPSAQLPPIHSLIEVEYLYAFNGSHNLHQPVYLGLRDDIDRGDCRLTQLKYQPITDHDDEYDDAAA
ncbi:MAG: WGR domain-containing protein [Nitrospira sp.]